MSDVIINNGYPGLQYEGTEAGASYFEDRENTGVMVRAQNAMYNSGTPGWTLQNTGKPAYAISQNTDGSLGFLTMPATQGSAPWTAWKGAGQNSVFNVRDFGAVGDNSHDDTQNINNAITACNAAGGGIVYFPATTTGYKVSETGTTQVAITLLSGVRLKGPNGCFGIAPGKPQYGAFLRPVAGAYHTIFADGASFCGVEDLAIIGGTDNTHYAMYFGSVSAGLIVRNVAIAFFSFDGANGIMLDGGTTNIVAATLENVSVLSGNSYRGGTGIQLGKTGEVRGCTFRNFQIQGMTLGFYDYNGAGNTVMGLWTQQNTTLFETSSDQVVVLGGWFEFDKGTGFIGTDFAAGSESCMVVGARYTVSTMATATLVVIDAGAVNPRVFAQNEFNPLGSPSTQPAVPGSGTPYYNILGTDATVFVSASANAGAAVTQIDIGGVFIPYGPTGKYQVLSGKTSYGIRVPVGQQITLHWTGGAPNAPQWSWFGD